MTRPSTKGAYAAIHLPQHPYLPHTLQASMDLNGHMAQGAEQLTQQLSPVGEPSLALGPIQN